MVETIEKQEVDKELLRKRFRCAVKTYNKHAVVQQGMAKVLKNLASIHIPKYHNTMAELGCGTGLLTKEIVQDYVCGTYTANDLVAEVEEDISLVVQTESTACLKFMQGDAEQIDFEEKQDVIWSGATMQWIKDLDAFFKRLHQSLNRNGYVAISSFDVVNFKEVKMITGKGIDYKSMQEVMDYASTYFKVLDSKAWIQQLWFDSPREVLKHMRFTGVNSVSKTKWGKTDLEQFNTNYQIFHQQEGYPLTYNPFVLILQKK